MVCKILFGCKFHDIPKSCGKDGEKDNCKALCFSSKHNNLLTKDIRLIYITMKNESQTKYKHLGIYCLLYWEKVKDVTLQSTSKTTLMI